MRRQVAAMQSALVAGMLVGPLPGAIAGTRLGFRLTFALGGLVLASCGALLQWGMVRPPDPPPETAKARRLPVRAVAVTSAIVLVASCQEAFLGAILPSILPGLGVATDDVVEAGGLLLFVSGAATAVGGLAAPYLADQIPERRLLPGLLAASSAALALFGVAGSLWLFVALRTLQSACIAPFFPLVVARVARFGGDAIGIVNAARVGSGLVGAVVATTLLAWGPPPLLYLLLGLAGLAAAALFRR
jgi:MFS family permease